MEPHRPWFSNSGKVLPGGAQASTRSWCRTGRSSWRAERAGGVAGACVAGAAEEARVAADVFVQHGGQVVRHALDRQQAEEVARRVGVGAGDRRDAGLRRQAAVVRVGVGVDGQAELAQVIGAGDARGGVADLLHGGQEQADQRADDGDDDQQFDREGGEQAGPAARSMSGSPGMRNEVDQADSC